MSRRTSQAQKAIAAAWANEQALVQEGKGTRDWTPEQQQSILDNGKAYDDDGRAFEGQHMKSAAEYPEYQGDPKNIQFLTRQEHFEAHDFNWQNPTNWYFDPITKTKFDFGEGKYIPCDVISLSNPIQNFELPNEIIEEAPSYVNEQDDHVLTEDTTPPKSEEPITERRASNNGNKNYSHSGTSGPKAEKIGFLAKIKKGVATIQKSIDTGKEKVFEFAAAHPIITVITITAASAGVEAIKSSGNRSSNSHTSSGGYSDYYGSDDYNDSYSSEDSDYTEDRDDSSTDDTQHIERSSPEEHTVSAHGQHYHTKDGVIWKEKDPYTRGGKTKDDDESNEEDEE